MDESQELAGRLSVKITSFSKETPKVKVIFFLELSGRWDSPAKRDPACSVSEHAGEPTTLVQKIAL